MAQEKHFETQAIHSGIHPDSVTGAILTPIYQTATYVQSQIGAETKYTYSRTSNPTVTALEENLGALEGIDAAVVFSSGMAAIHALFAALLTSGDHVICSDVVYGGTVRLLRDVFEKFKISTQYVDTTCLDKIQQAIQPNTRLILIETPANPTLKLTDIAAVAHIAHQHNILLAVDNTFLTPALQKPFQLGADIIIHSTTKYIDGHNATIGGALLAKEAQLSEKFQAIRNTIGAIQSPFDAWLTLQGVKTLALRIRQHSKNALHVAEFLQQHPCVQKVTYPGLLTFPQYALAKQQHAGNHGGILTFEVKGGFENAVRLLQAVRLCALAESLGSVETLITHPASMTHKPIPAEKRQAIGISDGLIRLSVGIENVADIITDLQQALYTVERS